MSKRILVLIILVCLAAFLLSGCQRDIGETINNENDDKIKVIATLFPPYDFAKIVGGDRVIVEKWLSPGVDSHTFEPTPNQLVALGQCDLFFYAGDYMEPWVKKVSGSIDNGVKIVDTTANITLIKIHDEGEKVVGDEHAGHDEVFDPHVWTDPLRAMQMVDTIAAALCEVDPDNRAYYNQNVAAYKEELAQLDQTFRNIVAEGNREELVFGGRFALFYFTTRYGLEYRAAFDSCDHYAEPSAKVVAGLIDEMDANDIPVVFYEELTEPTVALRIAEATGAKPMLFHTCHNVSKDEMAAGVTYLSLMRQNAENLREGLR